MVLNYKKLGSGHPLIILHGLYGSGNNWLSIAKGLSGICQVFLVDQRNHGDSPHHPDHNYPSLMNDLVEFLNDRNLSQAMVLGHSMGGKTAMWLATNFPGRISKMIIADMSPLSYFRDDQKMNHIRDHETILKTMMAVEFAHMHTIKDIDSQLAVSLPDKRLRQFLLTNLARSENKELYWRLNVKALFDNLPNLTDGIQMEQFKGTEFKQFPSIFIRGGESPYIQEADIHAIKTLFPSANLVTIKGAGHWLHADQPEMFTQIVKKFILEY